MSSSTSSLRAMISRISSCERSVTWATVSASTVVAPRRPLTVRAGAMAGHSTGPFRRPRWSRPRRLPARAAGPAEAASERTSSPLRARQRPGAQIRVPHGADPGAHEAPHRMADGLAHAADLAVAALVDHDAQHARRQHAHLGRRGRAVVELHALAQVRRAPGAGVPPATSARYSLATPCDGWVSSWESVAVVGEDEQPLGVTVEPADREHPGLGRHQRDDRRPPLGVVGGRDHAVRLVQQVVDEARGDRHQDAVELDPSRRAGRPGARAWRRRRRR